MEFYRLFLYLCYYPHWLRDSVSPECGIFYLNVASYSFICIEEEKLKQVHQDHNFFWFILRLIFTLVDPLLFLATGPILRTIVDWARMAETIDLFCVSHMLIFKESALRPILFFKESTLRPILFSKNRPLGRLFVVVAMSVYLYIYISICPLFMSTFLRPLIGAQVT